MSMDFSGEFPFHSKYIYVHNIHLIIIIGNMARSYQLKEVDGCTIIIPLGSPKLPINLAQMKDEMMEDTIINLYKFKVLHIR
jgi:hypothetical protein